MTKILNFTKRIYRRLILEYAKNFPRYEINAFDQDQIFDEIGLSRSDGLTKLNNILTQYFDENFDEKKGMYSEHLIMLSSISCINKPIKNILEIGTFDGRTALILSKLFEDANILTVDLPSTAVDFESTYNRHNLLQDFVENRNKNLANKRIKFFEINSVALADSEEKFDLIWIDGAHGYPVVSMDIINSYRLCNENGYVLVDDVWKSVDYSDKFYKSIAAHESLMTLKSSKLINDFYLVPKRLGEEFNLPWAKKYVGFFQC
jgi:predicted O-methyltransferase YrrM